MLSIIAIVDFICLDFLPEENRLDHLIQGIVIFVIVFVNIGLATLQELKAEKALEALQKSSSPVAKVIRDGKQQIIATKDLVVGDIVLLEEGCIVPADLRLYETNSLKIDESALTGESLSVEKDATKNIDEKTALGDRVNYAFSSTIVTYGSGIGIVCAIGLKTEIGKIAVLLRTSNKNKDLPPLKKKINNLTKILTIFAFSLLALMIVLNIVLYFAHIYPDFFNLGIIPPYKFWVELDTIVATVALAISLVPVALPVTTTVVLSVSVSKMAKKNALCKELTIVETIGNATVICTDKTGTLTLNKMTVTDICDYDDIVKEATKNPSQMLKEFRRYKHLLAVCMFCNNAEIDSNDKSKFIGDPTEAALIVLGENVDFGINKTRNKYKRVYEQPFDSDRKRMTTVYKTKRGYISFTKGSAESILELCSMIQTKTGVRKITQKDKNLIKTYLDKLSSKALRVLGMASSEFKDAPKKDSNYETSMTFMGLVGMIDPPRPEVFGAVKSCHDAGVRVAMITGDHQITALAIAHNLGIVEENDNTTLTGIQIDSLNDEQLQVAVKSCSVYARVSPDNKLRIVKAFKNNNEIVGMTGDGTNDAPALKEANVGIAMGISGTDVAKGAAGILLLDDNFTTIKTAINDGRIITRNIRNVISFILSTNLATALFIFIFTYVFGINPINITQRLLLDLVTDTLPCIFIGLNANDFGVMKDKANKNAKLLDKSLLVEVLINSLAIFVTVSSVFLISYFGFNVKNESTMNIFCFISLSLSRLLLSLTYVSKKESVFSNQGKIYSSL
jgi:Ca2+-transporting ATPase